MKGVELLKRSTRTRSGDSPYAYIRSGARLLLGARVQGRVALRVLQAELGGKGVEVAYFPHTQG